MGKITATFSNGHTDTYQGKRDVKAAWMIVFPDGGIESGHSIDRARAEKTARSSASQCSGVGQTLHAGAVPPHYAVYRDRVAKREGFRNFREYNKHVKEKRAEFVANCTIEVIDL